MSVTRILMPRIHGRPPHWASSIEIRSRRVFVMAPIVNQSSAFGTAVPCDRQRPHHTRHAGAPAHTTRAGYRRLEVAMPKHETATLGGGCFWCLEAVYQQLNGVIGVESGYAGGQVANPSYSDVCTGKTGHIEVVQVTFDPDVLSYRELLDVFFATHDPTSRDRQGEDKGEQYRSVIFTHSDQQRETAE